MSNIKMGESSEEMATSSEEETCENDHDIDVKEYTARGKVYIRRCKVLESRFKNLKQAYYKLRLSVNENRMRKLLNSDDALFKDLMKSRKEAEEVECRKAAELLRKSKDYIATLEQVERSMADNTKAFSIMHAKDSLRRGLLWKLKSVEDEYIEALVNHRLWIHRQEDRKEELQSDVLTSDYDDGPRGSFSKVGEQQRRRIGRNQPRIVYGLSEKRMSEELEKIRTLMYRESYRKQYYSYDYEKIFGAV